MVRPRVGRATLRMVVSMVIITTEVQSTARVHHRRGCPSATGGAAGGAVGSLMKPTIRLSVSSSNCYVVRVRRTSFADMPCTIAQTLEVVGEWWTLLIVRDAVLGVTRFDDWQRRLGIARNVLSARLDALVEHGILERRRYQEHPPRDEYVLTRKGRDLIPVLEALRTWGDRHAAPAGPPVLMIHDDCGHAVHSGSHCSRCGERLRRDRIHLEP